MRTTLSVFALLGSALVASAAPTTEARKNLKIVKTETNKFGQVIDWVEKSSQGEIAEPPPLPEGALKARASEELFEVMKGPEGAVPMLRANASVTHPMKRLPTPEDDESQGGAELDARAGAQGKHWYASTAQSVNNWGGVGTFSMFDAYVQSPGDFSLLQTAIIYDNAAHAGGNGRVSSQTVEAGWINYPNQVQQPHLFAFFNTNGYSGYGDNISGWNLDYAGFVQTDSSIYPGQPLQPLSVIGGAQHEIRIGYVYNGNWWLQVNDRYIGYYPGDLFSQGVDKSQTLGGGAKSLNFYGEIYNSETSVTTTDMGSGEFPEAGYLKTGYIHNIVYVNTNNQYVNYDGSRGQVVSDSNRYRQILHMNSGGSFGSWMDLGGPGAGGRVNG